MISPETKINKNQTGKKISLLKHAWKAQWITHPKESTTDYGVVLFRLSFFLKLKPSKFIIFVSADNRYRLYVNGEYIGFGPSIGDLANQRYETFDIADKLRDGENVIAAEVINYGEYKKVSQMSYQTAFILQGDALNDYEVSTGISDWKVIKNHAYTPVLITGEMLNSYYAAGACEKVDASIYPWGWNELSFDDKHWHLPKKAITEFAVGRGFLYGSAWFLVPRTIPFMEEKTEQILEIVRTSGISVSNDFLKGEKSIRILKNLKVNILFDQTFHTTGFPELVYSKGKSSKIKITYSEALFKDKYIEKKVSDGNLMLVDIKGNRNDFEGKSILGYYDIVLPDGGINRLFKPFSRKTYRFIELEIETKEEDLIIEKYYGVYTGYPFKEKAKFDSDDDFLNIVWDVSWRTLKNSAEESFFDPYYEQLQYIGDTKIESLVSIYVSGDDRLMRKALKQFDDSRIPEGLTQSRYPSNILQIIPTYSLIWIDMIHDYWMYRDDPGFLHQFILGIKSVLDWFISRIDDNGMLTNLSWWNFTDWTIDFPNGIPPGADDGYSANISLQLVKTLRNTVEIFSFFKLEEDAMYYKKTAKTLCDSVLRLCFDIDKGLIAETPSKILFSQHTNILGVLTDTFDKAEQKEIMEKVLYDESLIQTTIYFKFYLFRALQKVGFGERYMDLLTPWNNMIEKGMTTFGETDINPRSDCHGWSASPNFDFLHTIAGIYPMESSFSKVVIEPNLGKLERLYVEMPHPKGMIKVSFSNSVNKIEVELTLPPGLSGIFKWKGNSIILSSGMQILNLDERKNA